MISKYDDIIYVSEIEDEISYLVDCSEADATDGNPFDSDDAHQLDALRTLLAACETCTGTQLIYDGYFTQYASDVAITQLPMPLVWPLTCLDWDKVAEELQGSFTPVVYDGDVYWVDS